MRPIELKILANAARARAEVNSLADATEKSTGRMTSSVSSAGKKLGLGLAAGAAVAGAAVVKLGVDAVKSASDAQQSLGATETVFGRYANGVIRDSNRAARSVGLSANEYRELANVMGASLNGAGIPLKKTAELTSDINKRAADMAATFGGTTKDAVEAIGSLMRGEADPIERYGVSIKATDVAARLAAKGQDTLTGEAKKQAEMQARLDLVMQKTAKSQGAFGRESGTLAHQQQVLGAQFENIKAKVGTALLPVLTQAFTWINDKALPYAKQFGGYLADTFGPVFSKVAGFVRTQLIPAIRELAEKWIAGARAAFDNIKAAMERNKGTIADLKTAFSKVWEFIKSNLLPLLGRFYETVLPAIGTAIGIVIDGIKIWMEIFRTLWNVVLQPIIKLILNAFGALMDTWGTLLRALGKVPGFEWATKAGDKMKDAADKARGLAKNIKDIPPLTKVDVVTTYTYKGLRAPGGSGSTRGRDDNYGAGRRAQTPAEALGGDLSEFSLVGRRAGQALGDSLTESLRKGTDKTDDEAKKGGKKAGKSYAAAFVSSTAPLPGRAVKMIERAIEGMQARLDSASGIRDSILALKGSIADTLTGDLFSGVGDETGTALSKFRATLDAAKANADKVREAVANLTGQGIDPRFLNALVGSGNSELLLEIAASGDAKTLAESYGYVVAANEATAQEVAETVIGTRLDTVNATIANMAASIITAQQALAAEQKADRQAERQQDKDERAKGMRVVMTSDEVDQLTRGKRIEADLKAWQDAGGRRGA